MSRVWRQKRQRNPYSSRSLPARACFNHAVPFTCHNHFILLFLILLLRRRENTNKTGFTWTNACITHTGIISVNQPFSFVWQVVAWADWLSRIPQENDQVARYRLEAQILFLRFGLLSWCKQILTTATTAVIKAREDSRLFFFFFLKLGKKTH